MWDLSLLGLVPGLRVAAPRDPASLLDLLREAVADGDGPTAVRFPKGDAGPAVPARGRLGHGEVLASEGDADVLLLPVGPLAPAVLEAAGELTRRGVPVSVVDPRWVLPVEPDVVRLCGAYRFVVTVEDNGLAGGYGSTVDRALREAGVRSEVVALGLPQAFLPHGRRAAVLAEAGLDAGGIVAQVEAALHARAYVAV
jgi:1-deoxy-D-xylulose-5-phosphate synthase